MERSASYQTVVIKIGTNVISLADGRLDLNTMQHISDQIAAWFEEDRRVIVVSSGAVGAGKMMLPPLKKADEVEQRQVYSAFGQPELLIRYKDFFSKHNIPVAQVLLTKSDFKDREHYLNIRRCFEALWKNGILPIINENDTVSVSELMFTDNDELAGLTATMLNADALLIASNVEGLFDGDPDDASSRLLPSIGADEDVKKYVQAKKSGFGRGGMLTKIHNAQKIARLGIDVLILNGKKQEIFRQVMKGQEVGTLIAAHKKKSSVKKWLAYSSDDGFPGISVDEKLRKLLIDEQKVLSILPVGVEQIKGKFGKGQLVQILDSEGEKIGLGKAEYSSETLLKNLGVKGKKAIVHYDNLYVYGG